MSQLQVTGEAKIRDIQGPVVANSGVITALDGAANQYVRGDGTLASFPTSGGGGSSVSYYLNGSVNQGTFGGSTYYEMSEDAIIGAGTNFSASANGLIAQFITDVNVPDVTEIPSGNWNVEFFMGVSASSGALASFYVEIYKWDGTTFTLIATNVATPEQLTNTTTVDAYFTSVAMPTTALSVTDRLAVRIFVNVAGKTVTLYTEDNRLCQIVTTFSKGVTSINNLTDQSQYLTTGTSGTNFAIVSSGDTHTFNLPVASATNTGKLSSTDWSTFNNKQAAITLTTTGTTGVATFVGNTLNIPDYTTDLTGYVPYTGATGNVNLGAFSLTATNGTFTGNGIIDSNLLLKTAGKITTLSTYNTIYGLSTGFGIGFADFFGNDTIFNFSVSGDFNYTFPSITGTLALLEGTQTFSGLKTFSSTLATNALIVSGQLTLFSNITNGSYTYTLPSATGTLALTSQIVTISGTPNVIPRFNSAGTNIESGSIQDFGTVIGTPPSGFITMNARLTVNNYAEINRYLSIIQNVDSSWALPSTGTSLEAFITSAAGGTLINDTAYLRPRKASDDTFKRFVIQGDDLILNDTTSRRTLINKAGYNQSTTKLEVSGYTRFDAAVNLNGVLQFNATDSTTPTYLSASSGNVTLLTTGQITLGTNSVSKFVFDVNGALNLGTSDNSNIININNQFSTLNSTMQGVHITPSIVSASPVIYTGVRSYPQFFLSGVSNYAEIKHFAALNASNTQDNASQIGLYIENLSSIGLAYGIQSLINSGTSRYNLYISGTANNYFKGRIGVDQTNPQYAIDVTGDINVTGNFKVNGTNLTQGISGGGTQNYIPRYTSATTVGDSAIYQAPASGHLLVNTTFDYTTGGYLQVAGGFSTESFANIIYGSAPFAGNTVTLRLVNGNTIQGTGDRTYFIENRINTGATSSNYYLNYWDGGTTQTRYSLDNLGLHTFNGDITLSGLLSGANATFSGNLGVGTNNPTAVITAFSTNAATQFKAAGTAPAFTFSQSLTTSTYACVFGLATSANHFITGTAAGDMAIANQSATAGAIVFGTGTSEKMRMSPSGNFGLGTSNPSSYTNLNTITINGTSGSVIDFKTGEVLYGELYSLANEMRVDAVGASGVLKLLTNSVPRLTITSTGAATFSSSVTANSFTMPSTGSAGSTTWNFYHDQYAAGDFSIWAGSTTRFLINASGNVGIGTSNPSNKLSVLANGSTSSGADTTAGFVIYGDTEGSWMSTRKTSATPVESQFGSDATGTFLTSLTNHPIVFRPNNTERARITSGGNVLIGTTTDNGFKLDVLGQTVFRSNNALTVSMQRQNGDGQILGFYKDATLVGSISTNSNSLPSDLNFKKNINNLDLGLNLIKKLRSVSYNHKIDDDNAALSTGFIAQELEQSLTELGVEQNQYYILQHQPNEDETQSQYWLDYTKMIPVLVKAIQEQQAQIEELKQLIINK